MRHWLNMLRGDAGDVLGLNRRNLAWVYPLNPRWAFELADDKLLAKDTLIKGGIAVAPTLHVVRSFSEIPALHATLADEDAFVIKPAHGRAGRGVLVIVAHQGDVYLTPSGRQLAQEEIDRHVADILFGVHSLDRLDTALIEPLLRPSPFFRTLAPTGLSDVRVICRTGVPVAAMIRAPTLASEGRANIHQGAIGIAVDLETGAITRAWHRRRPITEHPDDGSPLVGQTVPDWPEIIALAERVARHLPLGYLGLDLVVDEHLGPLVLEFNARPGLEIQNVIGRGLRPLLEKTSPTSAALAEPVS